jgi:hypothetical protein
VSEPEIRINTNPTGSPTLGSATHQFRKRNFKAAIAQARWILIIAGGWSLVDAYLSYHFATTELDREVRQLVVQGADPMLVNSGREEAMSRIKTLIAAQIAMGIVFLAGGCAIKLAPVPIAIGCLAVYAAFHTWLAILNPATILMGPFGKAIFIAALSYAVRATWLFRQDLRKAEAEVAARSGTPALQ